MILADKIIELRKRAGWSQEDFATKLGVSRQAISKWEMAQSVPDLSRILKMSELFGVSVDTLIKDDVDLVSPIEIEANSSADFTVRILTLEEANAYLALKQKGTRQIAFGVMLCVLAIVPILLSDSLSQNRIAEPIGLIIAALFVLAAVSLILLNGLPLRAYNWMEEEPFETAYGVSGMVRERQKSLETKRITHIVIGVGLCICALIMLIASDLVSPNQRLEGYFTALAFAIVAIAVYLFVSVGIPSGAYKRILQEDDYSQRNKSMQRKIEPIAGIYWLTVTAGFLVYGFITLDWEHSWIIWPVAGVLFAVLIIVLEMVYARNAEK